VIGQGDARLLRSDDLVQAVWLQERVVGRGATLLSILPTGFPAYLRVLHPAERPWPDQPRLVRWAEVAERSGVTMHASIDFDELAAALDGRGGSERWNLGEPDLGNLEPEPLTAVCDILARHTATPEACWFGVWDGHGWLRPGGVVMAVFTGNAEVEEDPDGAASSPIEPVPASGLTWEEPSPAMPLFELPWRENRLLSGPLDAALEMGSVVNGVFFPHSPSLIWPDDHAWCVATDVDLRSTYIAATPALADDLLSDARLEVWPVQPDDPLS
jgi:hypothetical protein